jgi:hypothetical protein
MSANWLPRFLLGWHPARHIKSIKNFVDLHRSARAACTFICSVMEHRLTRWSARYATGAAWMWSRQHTWANAGARRCMHVKYVQGLCKFNWKVFLYAMQSTCGKERGRVGKYFVIFCSSVFLWEKNERKNTTLYTIQCVSCKYFLRNSDVLSRSDFYSH